MPLTDARRIERVRRYDLFKLVVAVLLFVAWLFATDRIPAHSASVGPSPAAAVGDATIVTVGMPELAPLRIESTGKGVRLLGTVPDEATRAEYLAAARKALGRPDRVEDGLSVAVGAERPDWLPHVGPALAALAGGEGLTATIEDHQVLLDGSVVDDAHRTDIADAVTAAFGAPFTVINRLVIAEPDPPRVSGRR